MAEPMTVEPDAKEMRYLIVMDEKNHPVINISFNIDQKGNNTMDENRYVINSEPESVPTSEAVADICKEMESPSKDQKEPTKCKPTLSCSICTYSSHRRYLFLRHLKCHSKCLMYKCSVCERGFKTAATLQNHMNVHTGTKPYVCKHCTRPFTTSGQLVRHVRYKHTLEKPHHCPDCDYATVERSKLRRHMRSHTGEKPYQCPHCTYASPDTFKLKRHLRTHTGDKPYQCEYCKMRFTQSNSLKLHKDNVHGLKKARFSCALCPATCGRKSDMRTHIQKLHSRDKPQVCRWCKTSFPDKYTCKVHTKTHKGEKIYRCELCPYATDTRRHLTSHIRTHTGEKPFICDDCNQCFRQKQLLSRHINLYHNPQFKPSQPKPKIHICQYCQKKFANQGNLVRHGMLKHGSESYSDVTESQGNGQKEKNTNQEAQETEPSSKEIQCGEIITVADDEHYVVLQVIEITDKDAGEPC